MAYCVLRHSNLGSFSRKMKKKKKAINKKRKKAVNCARSTSQSQDVTGTKSKIKYREQRKLFFLPIFDNIKRNLATRDTPIFVFCLFFLLSLFHINLFDLICRLDFFSGRFCFRSILFRSNYYAVHIHVPTPCSMFVCRLRLSNCVFIVFNFPSTLTGTGTGTDSTTCHKIENHLFIEMI